MRNTRGTTRPSPRQRGFTITELIVVISIIVLIMAILYPVIGALQGGTRVEAGLTTVGMSTDVARQWVASSTWDSDSSDAVQYESYSGTAALYCPTGEIRIVVNSRNAQDTGGSYLEDWYNAVSPIAPNGYVDRVGIDYIRMPDNVGVVGIVRFGSGANDVRFVAPPFAIAFDEFGHLHYGDVNGNIYYDANNNGQYNMVQARTAGYDPSDWDTSEGSNNATVMSSNTRFALPFEAIECVSGVVIYDTDDMTLAFNTAMANGGSVQAGSAEATSLLEKGSTLFFSPQSGIALRDEQE